ncbi:MAG TPA: glycosyltransferase family 4 protein [Actinomycetes bacterium]|nr:glycosyltransferase family 4 protein [Actinomycetes bacterium]
MKVGLVCPYAWDVPSGVAIHVQDLAEALIGLGHDVSVLTPGDEEADVPPYVVLAGRTIPVPFNGSIARVQFGPRSASRVRRWIREGEFDVLHVHSPVSPSLGMLACWSAIGPIVATFHASLDGRSRMMSAGSWILQATLEKVRARIAVSEEARRTIVENLGGDAVLIPNGVDVSRFSDAEPLPGWPHPDGGLVFLGRVDEPRKGLSVLLEAFPDIARAHPGVRLLIVGPGDADVINEMLPLALRSQVEVLGRVDGKTKARALASADVYVAPHVGGESFGIVLLEAMAAHTAVLASDLDAFRSVLDDGRCGQLFPVGDVASLTNHAVEMLGDRERLAELARLGDDQVAQYDWSKVAARIVSVYETVAAPGETVREDDRQGPGMFAGRLRRSDQS